MTTWDRVVYGAIAAAFGAILGAVAAVMVAFGLHAHAIAWSIAQFSADYFFAVGFVRGPDGGFFVGDALSALAAMGAAEVGGIPSERPSAEKPDSGSSVYLLVVWLLVVAVLAWRVRA